MGMGSIKERKKTRTGITKKSKAAHKRNAKRKEELVWNELKGQIRTNEGPSTSRTEENESASSSPLQNLYDVWSSASSAASADHNVVGSISETYEPEPNQFSPKPSTSALPLQDECPLEPIERERESNSPLPIPSTSKRVDNDEYDFTCLQPSDYKEIEMEELQIEFEPEARSRLQGNRVVDIHHVLSRYQNLYKKHSKICTSGQLEIVAEKRSGLESTVHFTCNLCTRTYYLTTFPKDSTINKQLVWGTLATGSAYAHTEELLSVMDIPPPSANLFYKYETNLGKSWHSSLWENLADAGKEEKDIAISKGNVDDDGVPFITVYLDGGWSKRSYGHNYNANSGVAVIIGKATSKVLYIGVRNKYCTICARAENLSITSKEHQCFKNWTASSSAMEADIIVQGFNESQEIHGVKFKTFIADGDSSVYAKIQTHVSYGSEVSKIECVNHVMKNYSKKLFMIKSDTKNISLTARKLLTRSIIKKLVDTAQYGIYQNSHGQPRNLEIDLLNSVDHVFENHKECKDHYCDKCGDDTNNKMSLVRSSGLYAYIFGALENVIKKKDMLMDNETNNRAETYMSILCRFNMGKRLNLIGRGSFERRAYLAALRYNGGVGWHASSFKKAMDSSPGLHLKKYISRKQQSAASRKLRLQSDSLKISKNKKTNDSKKSQKNTDYGPFAAEPVLDEVNFEQQCIRKLDSMKVSKNEIIQIAEDTVGQFSNNVYKSQRQHRLTASLFGSICKKRDKTPCHNYVKQILYPSLVSTNALEYGKINESVARTIFAKRFNLIVEDAGLFIHPEYTFLAASPDGLIGDEELVEIKCLHKYSDKITNTDTLKDFLGPSDYLQCANGVISLKKQHNYYYQVQGQLECTGHEWCYFVVYINKEVDIFVERIRRDHDFWDTHMRDKIIKFYRYCVLPEIILKRVSHNLKCTDKYFLEDKKSEDNLQKL